MPRLVDVSVCKKRLPKEISCMPPAHACLTLFFFRTTGAVTGSVFGFMDGMRTAGESPVLKKASNMAKGKYILQGASRSASIFGAFFGGFHVVKYGLRAWADPGEYTEVAVAGVITIGGMMVKPVTRPSIPYAAMLIFMDAIHIYMRDMDKK